MRPPRRGPSDRKEEPEPAVLSRRARRRFHLRLGPGGKGRRRQHDLGNHRSGDAGHDRGDPPNSRGRRSGAVRRGARHHLSRGCPRLRPLQQGVRGALQGRGAGAHHRGGARRDRHQARDGRRRLQAARPLTTLGGWKPIASAEQTDGVPPPRNRGGRDVIRLLGRQTSGNVQKVVFCLEELRAPYKREDYGRQFGNTLTDEYRKLNPNAKVPTMIDGDLVIWESHTILRYLAAVHGPNLTGATPGERSMVERWMDWLLGALNTP